MAPYLDAGILDHAGMDRSTDNSHSEGDTSASASPSEAIQTLKAVNDLLNKFFSTSHTFPNSKTTGSLQSNLVDELSDITHNALARATAQLAHMKNGIQEKASISMDDSTSSKQEHGIHAAKMKLSKTNGSGSLPGTSTATKVPALVTTDGAEPAQVPETDRADRQQGTITPDKTPAAVNGVTAAGHGANGATSGIRDQARAIPGPGLGGSAKSIDRLRALVETISCNVDVITSGSTAAGPGTGAPSEDVARIRTVAAANELLDLVRPPPDTIMGWFAQMSIISVVRVFQHWGVFEHIPTQKGEWISFAELAKKVGAEEALLVRMSWMLTCCNVLHYIPTQPGAETGGLAHTPTSLMLRDESPLASMFKLLHNQIVETSAIMPSYFDTYGRKEPVGPGHIPTSYLAGQPELPYFDLVNQDQDKVKSFMHAMSISNRRAPITGMFDLGEVIEAASLLEQEGDENKRPIWVDVGGSDGSVVKTFRMSNPGLKAEWCVVQDLPKVVEAAKRAAMDDDMLKGVQFLPMDFHKEAPVKGALVYYLRHIVHDYSDPVVINILSNIRKSMIPPSSSDTTSGAPPSRILISEQLIPYPMPPLYAAFKDYAMLAVGGKERCLHQFEAVAEAAGLVITGVYRDKGTPNAVVEMQVKV